MLHRNDKNTYNPTSESPGGRSAARADRTEYSNPVYAPRQAAPLVPYRSTDTKRKHLAELDRGLAMADSISMGPRLLKQARTLERHFLVEEFKTALIRGESPISAINLKKHQTELFEALPGFQARRATELALADKLEAASYQCTDFVLSSQMRSDVAKMRDCRQGGYSGIDAQSGARRTIWDEKCGKVRLCPDEARSETQRMANRYIPAIINWINERPSRRRVFYCVFTEPNFEAGRLAAGKAAQFSDYQAKITKATRPCTEADRSRHGYSSRKKRVPVFPQIKGSLVIQEDPLAAALNWNIHLNVLLLVDGAIDFADIRSQWGNNVEIRELKPEVKNLTSTFLEIIKYAAQFTASKSAAKRDRGATQAPPMLDWSSARLLEWYQAQQKFRRSRSYGCLYRLPPEIASDQSDSETQWITRFDYGQDGRYYVDLILENNFFNPSADRAVSERRNNGPPGRGQYHDEKI